MTLPKFDGRSFPLIIYDLTEFATVLAPNRLGITGRQTYNNPQSPPRRHIVSKSFLITGMAGFIGTHVAQRLLARGDHVVGLDNLNLYYDPANKRRNLAELGQQKNLTFITGDFRD